MKKLSPKIKEYKRKYYANKSAKAIEEGTCNVCFKAKATPGNVTCPGCRVVGTAYHNNRRVIARKANKCTTCFKTPMAKDSTMYTCIACLTRKANTIAAKRAKSIAAGMCGNCSVEEYTPGYVTCVQCRADGARYNKTNRSKAKATAVKRADSIAAGMCVNCNVEEYTPGCVTCAQCRADSAAGKLIKSKPVVTKVNTTKYPKLPKGMI